MLHFCKICNAARIKPSKRKLTDLLKKFSSRRITALLFRRIGDSLLVTPAFRALKKHRTQDHLSVIVEPQVARVFQNNPFIDQIEIIEPPSVIQLSRIIRHQSPDLVLDFLSDPRSALACLLSRTPHRYGFSHRGRTWFYSNTLLGQNPAHPIYSALHKAQLLEFCGCSISDITLDFFLTPNDLNFAEKVWQENAWTLKSKIAAFFISSRRAYKRWKVSQFIRVIQWMRSTQDIIPLILITPGDESAVHEVTQSLHSTPVHTLEVREIGQLGAILKRSAVLIGNDGGPKHLAVALNTPTVTIFISDPPQFWTPPQSDRHLFISLFTAFDHSKQILSEEAQVDSVIELVKTLIY